MLFIALLVKVAESLWLNLTHLQQCSSKAEDGADKTSFWYRNAPFKN
jgi:hypothetical protein